MPKRGENIHLRKDGRWEGRLPVKTTEGSKFKSVYGRSYREVKQKMQTMAANLNANKDVLFMTVAEEWTKYKKVAHKGATVAKYNFLIERHIRPYFAGISVQNVTPVLINEFSSSKMSEGRADGKGGLSPSYVRTMVIIICSIMDYAASNNLCTPLTSKVFKPVSNKNKVNVMSKDDQQKFEDSLMANNSRTSLGILISLYTGLRIGEVCALTWENIDFKSNIMHITSTVSRIRKGDSVNGCSTIIESPKTRSSIRDIPIPTKLQKKMKDYFDSCESKYVISDTNSFISPRTYEYRYHQILKECHISRMNYHTLRHTFATRCIEVGMDVKTLSELLGHSNVSITLNTYVHSSMDLKRMQIEKLCV